MWHFTVSKHIPTLCMPIRAHLTSGKAKLPVAALRFRISEWARAGGLASLRKTPQNPDHESLPDRESSGATGRAVIHRGRALGPMEEGVADSPWDQGRPHKRGTSEVCLEGGTGVRQEDKLGRHSTLHTCRHR